MGKIRGGRLGLRLGLWLDEELSGSQLLRTGDLATLSLLFAFFEVKTRYTDVSATIEGLESGSPSLRLHHSWRRCPEQPYRPVSILD
jgi:hypothetical protein